MNESNSYVFVIKKLHFRRNGVAKKLVCNKFRNGVFRTRFIVKFTFAAKGNYFEFFCINNYTYTSLLHLTKTKPNQIIINIEFNRILWERWSD